MDLFGKKQYEELDYVTQLIEPMEDYISTLFSVIPEKIDLTLEDLKFLLGKETWRSKIDDIYYLIEREVKKANLEYTPQDLTFLSNYFKIVTEGPMDIDLTNQTIDGTFTLIKIAKELEDKDLENRVTHLASAIAAKRMHHQYNHLAAPRIKEIADLFGCKKALTSRNQDTKTELIFRYLLTTIREDQWKLRDIKLISKIFDWTHDYINTGNLAAMTSLCRLKVMTHGGLPIYKFEETE